MNAINQLMFETIDSDTILTYAYDLNGNLLSKTDGADTTLYTWDYENRLVQISNSQFLISNEYDGDGNRISKTVNGVKTKYINDAGLPLVQVLMLARQSSSIG